MELIFLILLSGILLFLGISALRSNIKSRTNWYFLLFITSVIFWIFSNYFSNNLSEYWMVLLANRLIFVSTTFLVWILFLFAYVYPKTELLLSKKYYISSAIVTFTTAILGLTSCIVQGITIENNYSSIEFGLCTPVYLIHFVTFFLLFFIILIKKYKRAIGTEKVQLQYLLLGITFTAIGTMVTNLILPIVFNIFYLSNYGPVFFLIFVAFTFTAIARHRLFGIRFLLGQILFFLSLSLFTFSSFFLFGWLFINVFGGLFEINTMLASIVIAPIYSFVYLKFKDYIYKVIEEKFIYIEFHPVKTLSRFLKITSTELDINRIAVHVVNTIKNVLNLDKVGIILFNKDNTKILYKRLVGFDLKTNRDLLQIVYYWQDIGEDPILVLDEVKKYPAKYKVDNKNRLERITNCMESEGISAILPLNRKVQLNGIVIIGERRNRNPISFEDMEFLEDIIANASVAIGRAILYQEVHNFNETLKSKVAEQTKDLKEKVEELNEARRKEHDMIDIMGHELRTPVTIIKNYYELLKPLIKESSFYKDNSEKSRKYKEYIHVIGESIEREIGLINTLLSATKLDEGQLELNREAVDLVEVIKEGIMGQEREIKGKGLYIKFNNPYAPKEFPEVYADRIRIQEIVDNLISNAVKYTEKGGIEIKLAKEGEFARVEVHDTGIGIHKNNLKNLGKKFYRSKQYISGQESSTPLVRPGGTGLGLFVTFGLVKEHGGKVYIKSKLGEGSSFSFTVPLAKEEHFDTEKKSKVNNMFERLGLGNEREV